MSPTHSPRVVWGPTLAAAQIELRKMLGPMRLAVLGVLIALAGLIGVANQLGGTVPVPASGADLWPHQYLHQAFLRAVLPLVALYIGTCLWSEEEEHGTLVYLITRPVARPLVLLAKVGAAWLTVTSLLFLGMGATALAIGTSRGCGYGGLVATATVLPLASLAWLSLATLFGTMVKRSLFLALGVGFVMEMLLANLESVARTCSIGHHVASAVAAIPPLTQVPIAEMVAGEPVAAWVAWVTLASVTVGALTLACLQVRYKEYAPTRSD